MNHRARAGDARLFPEHWRQTGQSRRFLPQAVLLPMICQSLTSGRIVATNVHLTPELERFARECVEGGRYNNVSEVVRASLRLLQDAEGRRREFRRMLEEAEEEADREGDLSLESVMAEVDAIIAASEQ